MDYEIRCGVDSHVFVWDRALWPRLVPPTGWPCVCGVERWAAKDEWTKAQAEIALLEGMLARTPA